MRRETYPVRMGFALLIVLGLLVLVIAAAAAMAKTASTARLRREMDQNTETADDLLHAVDPAIIHWLETASLKAIIAPTAELSIFSVLHDRWMATGKIHEIRISAFDEFGRLPMHLSKSASPLRAAVPGEVLSLLDGLNLLPNQTLGLDLFVALRDESPVLMIYPLPEDTNPKNFTSWDAPLAVSLIQNRGGKTDTSPLANAIGAYVASHNPKPGYINLNTAPIPLITQAMRQSGRGGIEQVIAARQQGKFITLSSLPQNHRDAFPGNLPQLVTQSSIWSFRINLSVGSVRRSWWAIYENKSTGWECVQRLVISE